MDSTPNAAAAGAAPSDAVAAEAEAVAAHHDKPFELLSDETLGWLVLLGGAALACVVLPALLDPPSK